MLTLQELMKYEWVDFYDCRTNIKTKRTGAKVGKYLAIAGYEDQWKIYQVQGGLPIIDVFIVSLSDAVKIAQEVERYYTDYLSIWEIWTDVNILEISRLSFPDGEKVYGAICDLIGLRRNVSYDDFHKLLDKRLHG